MKSDHCRRQLTIRTQYNQILHIRSFISFKLSFKNALFLHAPTRHLNVIHCSNNYLLLRRIFLFNFTIIGPHSILVARKMVFTLRCSFSCIFAMLMLNKTSLLNHALFSQETRSLLFSNNLNLLDC